MESGLFSGPIVNASGLNLRMLEDPYWSDLFSTNGV